jgi:hypothetical protein
MDGSTGAGEGMVDDSEKGGSIVQTLCLRASEPVLCDSGKAVSGSRLRASMAAVPTELDVEPKEEEGVSAVRGLLALLDAALKADCLSCSSCDCTEKGPAGDDEREVLRTLTRRAAFIS